jgi:hypothetical protein
LENNNIFRKHIFERKNLCLLKVLLYFIFQEQATRPMFAKWMTSVAAEMNIESSVFNIAAIERNTDIKVPADSIILFVSPVHGFNYPPVMLHFIARFPKGKNKVILMDTRAGMLIGNFNLPGLSGAAFYLSSLFLKIKGYSIAGIKSVDLPSNWMSLHPTLSQKAIYELHKRQKAKVVDFGRKVLSGEKSFIPFMEFVFDLIIFPITIGYYFYRPLPFC